MKIRLATLDDLNIITAIYNQAVATQRSTGHLNPVNINERKEWFKEHDPDTTPIFVAEVDAKVCGYAYLTYYRGGRKAFSQTREISYFVDNSYQRKGLANHLYSHVVSFCEKHKIETLLTFVLAHNEPSINFLLKNGFSQWGALPRIAKINNDNFDHIIYGIRLK